MNATRQLIDDLVKLETIKTWSLIVTLFGDLKDQPLSGKQISGLLGHIGLKPEAIRVALHRLKVDGWVLSEKNGREVLYRLSDHGLSQTASVSKYIYQAEPKYPNGWQLLLHEGSDAEDISALTNIVISKKLSLVPVDAECEDAFLFKDAISLSFNKDQLPSWFSDQIIAPEIVEDAEILLQLAENFDASAKTLNSLDKSAIRLLFLHHWRKMALRENSWAHIYFYPDGALSRCQFVITKHMQNLPAINVY